MPSTDGRSVKPWTTAAVTAVVVGAATLVGSSAASQASQSPSPSRHVASAAQSSGKHSRGKPAVTRLHFNVHFSPFDLIDVDHSGPHNFTNGDEIVFHDQLFARGQRRGEEGGSCVIVDGTDALANCTAVVRLKGGLISYQFLNQPPPNKILAVTGGTGRFFDAGGGGLLHEDATGPTGTLTLRLSTAHHG